MYLYLRGLTNSPCRIIISRTADTFIVNIITANTIIVVINVTVSLLLDSLSFAFFFMISFEELDKVICSSLFQQSFSFKFQIIKLKFSDHADDRHIT